MYAFEDCGLTPKATSRVVEAAIASLFRAFGTATLTGAPYFGQPERHLSEFVEIAHEELVPSVIEALWQALVDQGYDSSYGSSASPLREYEERVNEVLRRDRVAWELIEGEMVALESQELHAEVVAPLLRLLSGRSGWKAAEDTYRKALSEIETDPSDAITDAGTLLQEVLRLLGCEGSDIAHLSAQAVTKGILSG